MKPMFEGQDGAEKEKRADFGDAPISNAKHSCENCPLRKEGCKFTVNTLHCVIANKRLLKILNEEKEEKEDAEMENEQNNSLSDLFRNAPTEGKDEDDD